MVHRQAAFVVGGDAIAGIQVDVGKTQHQTVKHGVAAGLGERTITKLDALGVDIQSSAAGPGAVSDDRARCARGTLPDQIGGVDGRDIFGIAQAVDRRGRQHQIVQQRLAGLGVVGVQQRAAIEVERLPRRQLQGFQRRGTGAGVTAQQSFEHLLVKGQARWQHLARGCIRQPGRAADVNVAQGQRQVTGAITHGIVQLQGFIGGGNDTALGIDRGLARTVAARAHTDLDIARRVAGAVDIRQHIDQAIGHGQHARHTLVNKPVASVIGGCTATQGGNRSPLLDHDAAGACHDHHFRCREGRTAAQKHRVARSVRAIRELDDITVTAIFHLGQAANKDALGIQIVKALRRQRQPFESLQRAVGIDNLGIAVLEGRAAQVDNAHGAAVTAFGRFKLANAVEGEGVFAATAGKRQLEGFGVHFQHGPWHTEPGGIGHGELGVAGFVVLRITAQGVGRGQDHLAVNAVVNARIDNRQLPGR